MKLYKSNGNVLIHSDRVKTFTFKFKNYEIIEHNNNRYLIGYNLKNIDKVLDNALKDMDTKTINYILNDDSKPIRNLVSNKPNKIVNDNKILESLLTLSDNIFKKGKQKDKCLIAWCNKNGLPILCDIDNMGFSNNIDIIDTLGYPGFNIDYFLNILLELYSIYLLSKLNNDDTLVLDELTKGLKIGFTNELSTTYDNKGTPIKKHDTKAIIHDNFIIGIENKKEQIERLLNSINLSYHYEIDNNNVLNATTTTNNLISLSIYQLALFLLSNDNGITKKCECCYSTFIASRNNQKYCINCNPKKAYYQKTKNKKVGVK